MLKTAFFGTGEFAVPAFDALAGHPEVAVALVVSQPDRPRRGAGAPSEPSPVKRRAAERGLAVATPERIRKDLDLAARIAGLGLDVAVVAAYGQIIPASIFDAPRHGSINVHGSLLPLLRGAAPIQWAIREGHTETGVTIMRLDREMDHGPVLARERTPIGARERASELSARLARLGADLLLRTIFPYARGEIAPEEQDHASATYARPIAKEDGAIDWSQPAAAIDRQIRAFDPWPGAFTYVYPADPGRGRGGGPPRVEILDAEVWAPGRQALAPATPGVVLEAREKHQFFLGEGGLPAGAVEPLLLVRAGGGTALRILRAKPAGKRAMDAAELVRGRFVAKGDRLGPAAPEGAAPEAGS